MAKSVDYAFPTFRLLRSQRGSGLAGSFAATIITDDRQQLAVRAGDHNEPHYR